jgi:hypothetical protein
LGDTKGRRICLLVSVTMMAIPTVLIGCLPTFAQAGLAAPILLALLRAVQGLAMGGALSICCCCCCCCTCVLDQLMQQANVVVNMHAANVFACML